MDILTFIIEKQNKKKRFRYFYDHKDLVLIIEN